MDDRGGSCPVSAIADRQPPPATTQLVASSKANSDNLGSTDDDAMPTGSTRMNNEGESQHDPRRCSLLGWGQKRAAPKRADDDDDGDTPVTRYRSRRRRPGMFSGSVDIWSTLLHFISTILSLLTFPC